MRRHRLHLAAATLVVAAVLFPATLAGAQTTTTTTPPVTTVPTTVPVTTPASTLSPGTTAPGTATTLEPVATTAPAATSDDDGSSIPWIPIAVGVLVIIALAVIIAIVSRKRGAARQLVTDWKRRAADATAEAGATARLLSQGTPPSGQIAQQLLASLRAFEDLEQSAPDDTTAATAERARRALQTLGLAIDSDYRLRRSQGVDPRQLARSQESVQNAAGETDRTLRGVYRSFTGTE
jgi:hypothetical protein